MDFDGDGFDVLRQVCADEGVALSEPSDCDDDNPATFPGAQERCNGLDDDCDGEIDESGAVDGELAWVDEDRDGFGVGDGVRVCALQIGLVRKGGDCDDDDESVHPDGADDDHCDGRDVDCDGATEGRVWLDGATGYQTVALALAASPDGARLELCDGSYDLVSYDKNIEVVGVCEAEVCSELRASSVQLTADRVVLANVDVSASTDGPGLRVVSRDVSIEDVTFRGHTGGALELELTQGEGVIRGASFVGNRAERGGALSARLGADARLSVRDSSFVDNGASIDGGAIWVAADSAGSLTMQNVQLTDNQAAGDGGAIAMAAGSSTALSMDQCDGNGNSAQGDGGVIWSDGSVDLARFTATGDASVGRGGVAYLAGVSKLSSVVIESSEADVGGAFWFDGSVEGKLVRIARSAAREGGGVYVAAGADVQLSSLALDENAATERGGGALVVGSLSSLGCDVSNNTAADGAGMAVVGTLRTEECVLNRNQATEEGGALQVVGTADMKGISARFNTAKRGAGAFVSGVLRCSDGANDGLFAENKATEAGGAVYLGGESQLRSTSCSYDDNSAPVGSALAFARSSKVLFKSADDTFDGNKSAPAFEGFDGSIADLQLRRSRFFDHDKGVFKLGLGYKLDCVGCNWSGGSSPNAYSVTLPSGTSYSWTYLADVVCDDAACRD